MALRHLLVFGLLLMGPCTLTTESVCDAQVAPLEYQVKAAFLLNFTKFIEWPPAAFLDARSPLTICILGEDPFGTVLDQMVSGETLNGRQITLRRIQGLPEPKTCQVIFFHNSERNLSETLAGLAPGTLTVGEGDDFLRQGGIVAFVVENRRVRFDVNRGAAATALLTISSRLLNVARFVVK